MTQLFPSVGIVTVAAFTEYDFETVGTKHKNNIAQLNKKYCLFLEFIV